MATQKVEFLDKDGNVLYGKTLGELVENAQGDTLENVEAGAQVNKIEKIKLDGAEQTITDKAVDLPVYTKTQTDTAIATANSAKQDKITSSNKLNADLVDDSTSTNKFVTAEEKATYAGKQNAITSSNKLNADLVDDSTSTNKFVTAEEKATYAGKQDAIADLETIRSNASDGAAAKAAVDAMGDIVSHNADEFAAASHTHTSSEITDLSSTISTAISGKADSATTLAGYGITDAYTKTEMDAKISSTYKAGGNKTFATLPALSSANEGFVYNVTDAFETTTDFVEGAGNDYPAGSNVAIVNVGTVDSPSYKYDVLAGFVDTSAYDSHISDSTIHVTSSDKATWNGKQDAIDDLATIRSGASAGATAIQPNDNVSRLTNDAGYLVAADISGKQDTITGAATTIVSDNLTASKAMVSDENGKVAVSSVTSTELGYLAGVTSSVQTQINGKADSATTLAGYGIVDGVTYRVIS